ncbi:MAG: polysaccharide pyruvyl transferase family protein [Bacteroidota bacterium]
MKIGLITFHNALNYGAALQAYATQKYLNKLGHECIIIDYTNECRAKKYDMKSQIFTQLKEKQFFTALRMGAGLIFMELRRKNFSKFYKDNTKRTRAAYTTNSQLKELNKEYDFFIVGSDQVWNHVNNGADTAYFLDFVTDKKKTASYASSFGTDGVPENLRSVYKQSLSEINHLSTRESLGVKVIKELTGRDAGLVLDPVFLLNKQEWISLIGKTPTPRYNYIFSYTNRKGQLNRLIELSSLGISGKKIHKICRYLTVNDFFNKNIKVDYFISPIQFLNNILNADLIATASFHCIALSIIFNKKFVAFLTGDKGKDERVINLLSITGLTDRIYNEKLTAKDIYADIDYTIVEEKLEKYRIKSQKFIKIALSS